MGLAEYLNNDILNVKLSVLLSKYDRNKDGFDRNEFKNVMSGTVNIWAYRLAQMIGYDKKLFKELDIDKNKIISYSEIETFLKNEYNLELSTFMDKTVQRICEEIDSADIKKNKSEQKKSNNEWNG